jgi:AcrR family transcriptional regulator
VPKPPNPELARRILEIAREELIANPPEAVSMRGIAERVGVSPTAIYYYYDSKVALFEAISFEAIDSLLCIIEEAGKVEATGLGKLRALARSFMKWCDENPHQARLMMERLPAREGLSEEKLAHYNALSELAKRYLEEAVEEGSIASRDAELDISVAQAALWGIFVLRRAKRVYPRFWDSDEALVERFMELLLRHKEN